MIETLRSRPTGRPRGGARRRGIAACALILLSLLFAGCGPRVVPLEDTPLPYRQAEDSFRLGNYEKAARGYQIFLDGPKSEDYEELVPRAYYRLALSEYRRGRYQECLLALDRMEQRVPDKEWPQVYTLRGDAELARGKTMQALRWWEQAWQASDGEEKRAAKQHIVDALDRMDAASLNKARDVFTTPEMRQLVDAKLGPRSPTSPAVASAASAPGQPLPPAQVSGVPSDQPVATTRIGVLLPLSGEFAPYGQRSLNGIKLALGPLASQLDVKDTKGDPAAARVALDAMVADPNIVTVVGPLRSKEAEIIAPRAERAGLPMVLLAQSEGVTGQWVLQPAMTSARQAAALAEYAMGSQGQKKFAVLYPNDQYGTPLSSAFKEQVEQRGGQVVGALSYDPHQREFSVEALSVAKWVKDDGAQAVFIPDFATNAIPLATQLRKAQPDIALLGSNGWDDPTSLAPVAADLDGAVFVDGFFASSTRSATQQFVAGYRGAYNGTMPEILEAQAYDAGLLVMRALQTGARSRMQMAQALRAPRTIDGAGGLMSVSADGIQRQLFLLRLTNGTISELTPSGKMAPRPVAAAQ